MKPHLFLWHWLEAPFFFFFFLGELQGCYLACHLELLSPAQLAETGKGCALASIKGWGFLRLPKPPSPLSLTK